MSPIKIVWTGIRPWHGAENDERRAIRAAETILSERNVNDYAAAEATYRSQMERVDGNADLLTGDALSWHVAQLYADLALTEEWREPDSNGCTISAA